MSLLWLCLCKGLNRAKPFFLMVHRPTRLHGTPIHRPICLHCLPSTGPSVSMGRPITGPFVSFACRPPAHPCAWDNRPPAHPSPLLTTHQPTHLYWALFTSPHQEKHYNSLCYKKILKTLRYICITTEAQIVIG